MSNSHTLHGTRLYVARFGGICMSGRRGRERLHYCESCGRAVPRDKAVEYSKRSAFSTDLRGEENVTAFSDRTVYYCISCAKHRKIFERKKEQAARRRERF